MAEVVTMPGVVREEPLKSGEPSAVVIERLEELLAQARRGEFQRIAYATAGVMDTGIGWCGEGSWDVGFAAICDLQHTVACERRRQRLSQNMDIV